MSLEVEMHALRATVGVSRPRHIAAVHVGGPDGFDLVQRASTRRLHLREGQLRQTLFLRDDAGIFADILIAAADDGFYVLAEGPSEAELADWLAAIRGRTTEPLRASVRGVSAERTLFAVDGPYAWELASALLGPSVLGMPYLTLLRRDDMICFRAGKTGEYGYLLLVPRAVEADVEAKLEGAGRALEMVRVSLDALDLCALENWHFSVRTLRETALARPLTPIELQLQWRVDYDKEFPGAGALRARRAEGAKVRATSFTADGPLFSGQSLRLADGTSEASQRLEEVAGEVLAARFSPTMGMWVGAALLATRLAHPHLLLTAMSEGTLARVTTRTTPLVENASLRIEPHKHSFATRGSAVQLAASP